MLTTHCKVFISKEEMVSSANCRCDPYHLVFSNHEAFDHCFSFALSHQPAYDIHYQSKEKW